MAQLLLFLRPPTPAAEAPVELAADAAVGDLSAAAAAALGAAPGSFVLSHAGRPLAGSADRLADCGVSPESGIDVAWVEARWDRARHREHVRYSDDGRTAVFEPRDRWFPDWAYLCTEHPVCDGTYEMVMRKQGDEVCCGLTDSADLFGPDRDHPERGWMYYGGRRGAPAQDEAAQVQEGAGESFFGNGREVNTPARPFTTGDVVGMRVDTRRRTLQFLLNGAEQGPTVRLPPGPLWAVCTVDFPGDEVYIRRA